ncbi:MAG: DUF397 domain-containing protein [Mycobacterium sp.]
MDARDLSRATWRKSSYSNGPGGNCVEVAELSDGSRPDSSASRHQGALRIESCRGLVTSAKPGPLLRLRFPSFGCFLCGSF